MQFAIQNHILSSSHIQHFSYNHQHALLAAVIDGFDTVCFYVCQQAEVIEIWSGLSKPSGQKSALGWSHDGEMLALASTSVEVWKLSNNKLIPHRTFNEDFIEVKMLSWSMDDRLVAFGGLHKDNFIQIRTVEDGTCHQIHLPLSIAAISFDPFGKYLLLLIRNNILAIYNSHSFLKIRQIALSPQPNLSENINTVKQTRCMSWSPDFNDLICPSLDDSKISLAIHFNRAANFSVQNIYIGHVSSISCVRFNPNLYEFEGHICSIVAMGDSNGVLSLWRIAHTQKINTPLLISNALESSYEVIEDIEWSKEGDTLLINSLKNYVSVYRFQKQHFGKELTHDQKISIIEDTYGIKNIYQIKHQDIQVFDRNNFKNNKKQITINQISKRQVQLKVKQDKIIVSTSFDPSEVSKKVQYVKINDQKVSIDKNNKKRIQPAMLVRKQEIQKSNQMISDNKLNANSSNSSSQLVVTIQKCYTPIQLKSISFNHKLMKVTGCKTLQIRKMQGLTLIQLNELKENQVITVNERIFSGNVDYLSVHNHMIYILNQGNLFIFDQSLSLKDLPLAIGQIHMIAVNHQSDIYYVTTKGLIRGFNQMQLKCYTPSEVYLQSLLEIVKPTPPFDAQADSFLTHFYVETNHNLYVGVIGCQQQYFYEHQTGSWLSLSLNRNLIKEGHSLRVSSSQEALMNSYFSSLNPKLGQSSFISVNPTFKSSEKEQKSIRHLQYQEYESNMIYYQKYHQNIELFNENLLRMIKEMKEKNQVGRLRDTIFKYFIDSKSEKYVSDNQVRQKVRRLGGTVVEEFMLFGKL